MDNFLKEVREFINEKKVNNKKDKSIKESIEEIKSLFIGEKCGVKRKDSNSTTSKSKSINIEKLQKDIDSKERQRKKDFYNNKGVTKGISTKDNPDWKKVIDAIKENFISEVDGDGKRQLKQDGTGPHGQGKGPGGGKADGSGLKDNKEDKKEENKESPLISKIKKAIEDIKSGNGSIEALEDVLKQKDN